ncbi:MAG TPA: serine hydrolase domain-containing protein [Bacteroidales bacterium]|nr:serine hydrolase domain-containing protein [Bacteroidales bacterium]
MKRAFSIIFISFIICFSLLAQNKINIDNTQIDNTVKRIKDSLNIPGMAIGIALGGEIKYISAHGYANLETNTPLNLSSIWHICSVSKQFSTVACLKLVEENKLALSDKISKYLDQLPERYSGITISYLLSQTSGIKDYINELNLYGLPWSEVKKGLLTETLNFKPGDSWSYSNTGFWIVAQIIEKVTGMDYNQYLEQNFFAKLKMLNTHRVSTEKALEMRVNGYVPEANGFKPPVMDIRKFYGQGDGDLMSTINDLLAWNIALTQGEILNKDLLLKLWTPSKLNNGNALEISPGSGVNYGLGWFIKSLNGDKVVWTPGSGFGFSTSLQYLPKYNLIIVVFCNREQFLMADEVGFSVAKKILNQ